MIESIYLIGVAITLIIVIIGFILEPETAHDEDIFSAIAGSIVWPLAAFIIILGLTVKGLGKIYEYFRNNKSK